MAPPVPPPPPIRPTALAAESFVTPVLDVLAKIVFSIVMVTGDFSRLDAEIENELRLIDQGERWRTQRRSL